MSHSEVLDPRAKRHSDLSDLSEGCESKENDDDVVFECWMPADPSAVPEARHEASAIWRKLGADEAQCLELDLALGEALANAVRHGAESPRHTARRYHIHISSWTYGDSLITLVHDCGPGFDPPTPPYTMPPAVFDAIRGRGLPLMEMLTDAFLVSRGDANEGGASIFLVKRIRD